MKNIAIIILLSTLLIAGCGGNSSSVPVTSATIHSTQTSAVQTNKMNQGQDQSKKSAPVKQSTTAMPSQNSASTNTSPLAEKNQTSVKSTAPTQPVAKAVHQTSSAAITTDSNTKAPVQQTVFFAIIGANHKTIVPKMEVPIKSNDTVLSILKEITREKGIQMEYRGSGAAAYVEGIDNVYEMDQGPKSGWMFRVNGNFGDCSCGAYAVHDGDVIQWLYTTNLGKDLGK